MTIIENAERYMKRYDYLIKKRERKHNEGKRLTKDEDEELQKLQPNVVTPIFAMFELLHDIIKSNQEARKYRQSGGNRQAATATPPAVAAAAAAAAASAAAAAATAGTAIPTASSEESDPTEEDAKEEGRLMELEESLLPLLTKIIVYIEQNKKAEKKKDDEEEEEKYPDIGTTAKNSAILVIRRIKKWWNDLIQGGSSDLSSKINLKKAIPQLADNSVDMNKLNEMADKVVTAVDPPLKKIEKLLSNDVRDIASSSVEGIMNALSLIPGIGTTLQLWRLLQNVIVIMSKSVTTMAGAKTEGVALKTGVLGLKDQLAGDAMGAATGAAQNAASDAMGAATGAAQNAASDAMGAATGAAQNAASDAISGATGALSKGMGDVANMMPKGMGDVASTATKFAGTGALLGKAPSMIPGGALNKVADMAGIGGKELGAAANMAGNLGKFLGGGGAKPHTTNHLRSIKKYKREYKQSLREIRKTRKKLMKYIRNII